MDPLAIEAHPSQGLIDAPALALSCEELARDFRRYFTYTLGRSRYTHSRSYIYQALALTIRDRLMERSNWTRIAYEAHDSRRTCYLSMEYLMGRTLGNAVLNLGIEQDFRRALDHLGLSHDEVVTSELDAGLGNGGLGRLAACFLDSCATLQLPVIGYGIRYSYGMFRQRIVHGHQQEEPDAWLLDGYPWEIERPEYIQRVRYKGRSESYYDRHGKLCFRWVETEDVLAVPFDIPIPGFKNDTVNTLRLWSAKACSEFNLGAFNAGSYTEAVAAQSAAENITMVLYPNDASECGKALRLRQQYFLASASLQDALRQWRHRCGHDFSGFADQYCFQLNDTHPTIAVAELMRLLMDEDGLGWDQAWSITTATMAYTNHTLLPEALETWSVGLFREWLPRLLEIIFEINARFLAAVARRWPRDLARLRRMSIIEESDHGGGEQRVRMAYLAIVGSFSVNGVAALHSQLLQEGLFRDFHELWPEKFNNKTNGVTQRRWLLACNRGLSGLITEAIGEGWPFDLDQLKRLKPLAWDSAFAERWRQVKFDNKARLAHQVAALTKVHFDPAMLFDVQVKRIHEYKRQLLNVLHLIHLYLRVKDGDTRDWTPRCVLFGGKAAPGYAMAKRIVKLIHNVAAVINNDPQLHDYLRVAFYPNYGVSAMELICPGTDLSEQISTAGKEASGTGNMKFMMNGAVTIGTLDGANIEIRQAVGAEHFFLFGLNAQEVVAMRSHYRPEVIIYADEALSEVMRLLESGYFNALEPGIFDPLIQAIKSPADPWMVAADFRGYIDAQELAAERYGEKARWTASSIANTAASGRFSTDRTIAEYNRDIWRLEAVAVGG